MAHAHEFGGKEKLLSLGRYPDLGLADARDCRQEAKQLLRKGFDPALARVKQRLEGSTSQTNTFEIIARDWHARNKPSWTERHAADVLVSLERDVFPSVGALPITDFTPPMILNLVRPIEARPAIETARRVRQRMSAIFVYAIASGLAQMDPAAIVQGAMAPLIKGRQPAVLDLTEAREILNRADAEPAHPITKLALRLLALTAVRPGEIRGAAWVEFENLTGDEPLWRIPAARMKMKREHVSAAVATSRLGYRGRASIHRSRSTGFPECSPRT